MIIAASKQSLAKNVHSLPLSTVGFQPTTHLSSGELWDQAGDTGERGNELEVMTTACLHERSWILLTDDEMGSVSKEFPLVNKHCSLLLIFFFVVNVIWYYSFRMIGQEYNSCIIHTSLPTNSTKKKREEENPKSECTSLPSKHCWSGSQATGFEGPGQGTAVPSSPVNISL